MCFRVTMQGPRRYLQGGSVLHPLRDINDHHPLPSAPNSSIHISPPHSIPKSSSPHTLFHFQTPELNPTTNYFPVVALPFPSKHHQIQQMSPPPDKPNFPPTAENFDIFCRVLVLGEETPRFELPFELRAVLSESLPKQLEAFILDLAKTVEENLDLIRRLYAARSLAAYGETKDELFRVISANDRFWNTLQIKFEKHIYLVCGRIEITELAWKTGGNAPRILASMQKEVLVSGKLLKVFKVLNRAAHRTAYELERGPAVR